MFYSYFGIVLSQQFRFPFNAGKQANFKTVVREGKREIKGDREDNI